MRAFALRLAGSDWRDRVIATSGATLALAAMAAAFAALARQGMPLALVSSVGASAVLVFVVPSSPLVQPWPVIGGSVVSAAVGMGAAWLPVPIGLGAGAAIGVAILAMSLLRCLHPPGGALALLGVLGQAQPYPLALVALNAAAVVALGWIFHRFSGHAYPHRAPPMARAGAVTAEDVDAALDEIGESFDVDREDLVRLVALAAEKSAARTRRGGVAIDVRRSTKQRP